MRVISLLLYLVFIAPLAFSQQYNPLHPPNSYQSPNNPNYWKNKLPFNDYWQQDVHYTIKANIDEKNDIIEGQFVLKYTNNSPDDLDYVYFHLYQNAYKDSSYLTKLNKANHNEENIGRGIGTVVSSVEVNGSTAEQQLDNTILKIKLPQPLKSGTTESFKISFKTYVEYHFDRRMKRFHSGNHKHYSIVHWYPRICVYDRKFGWTTDQHLGKEFYGDFGTFDVELTFSDNFIVGATGNLLNRSDMLPDDLRKKLDIKNFTQKVSFDSVSVIIPYNQEKRKTWVYHAENVHDFAFTANPSFRIGEAEWNGIKCYSLAREENAYGWQNAASYTAKVIETYSTDFGMYTYHKMIVADAKDGMEYPMLTLDGGSEPNYRGLLAHEVGHNWFYGQVGTNETYRAMLDEGFTNFLSSWALEKIDGDTMVRAKSKSNYVNRFTKPQIARHSYAYRPYFEKAIKHIDPPLNTHSDDMENLLAGNGYRQVYYKTASMLYALQYTLGDELFLNAMKYYFEKWKIAHPYVIDFRNTIIEYTKVDLNWFFDQWMETSKTVDYSLAGTRRNGGENQFIIKIKRKGEMQMPIDFVVYSNNGERFDFHIPNTWFVKKTDAKVLPKWYGFGKINPVYEAEVLIPGGIREVIIDPTYRLADINPLNNGSHFPSDFTFDSQIPNRTNVHQYEIYGRPDAWYNVFDGVKAGFNVNGHYMNFKHILNFTTTISSGIGQSVPQYFSIDSSGIDNTYDKFTAVLNYKTGLPEIAQGLNLDLTLKTIEGYQEAKIGLEKLNLKETNRFYSYFKLMYRKDSSKLKYLLFPEEWIPGKLNNTINIGYDHNIECSNSRTLLNIHLKSSTLESDYDFSQLSITAINHLQIGKLKLHSRAYLLYGTGNNTPKESALFLATGNPEQMMDHSFYRSNLFFADPDAFINHDVTVNNLHYGGGLNLRGYSGYLAPEIHNDSIRFTYSGTSGGAVNLELDFNSLVNIRGKLNRYIKLETYLFADAGMINSSTLKEYLAYGPLRVDAGIGSALTIKRWGVLQKIKPLTIRFDVPFFLNKIPYVETDNFDFRWVIGINRSF